jgi:hypothetical protein
MRGFRIGVPSLDDSQFVAAGHVVGDHVLIFDCSMGNGNIFQGFAADLCALVKNSLASISPQLQFGQNSHEWIKK